MQSQYNILLFLFSCWFETLLATEDTSMGFLLFMDTYYGSRNRNMRKLFFFKKKFLFIAFV